MDEKFMRRAIELAKQAETFDEVPIGAVIVLNGEIVAEGNNRKERDNSAISHAEIVALKNANEKLGWKAERTTEETLAAAWAWEKRLAGKQ